MLTSGQLLADRYRLRHRIAVGGMGEVWQSVDVRLDRAVAVKVLKPELCGDAEFLHRFRTEARTTAALNHPGIAAVHDYGETSAAEDGAEDTAYLVMEMVEGEPLAAILAREGRVRTEHTLDMLEQAGRALQAAHERGLVHRDVKPGNILITADGTVKLTDFGIAKAADAAPVTRSGMVMGTAHYIAPEQALGSDATPSSDVYSLAVVGYECLMGHRPFLSDNAVTVAMMHIRDVPPPLPPDVPCGVRQLVESTLVKDPRQRYADGGEFAGAVAGVRAGGPVPAPAALAAPPQPGPPVQSAPVPPGQAAPGQAAPGQAAPGQAAPVGFTAPGPHVPQQQPGQQPVPQQAAQPQATPQQAAPPAAGRHPAPPPAAGGYPAGVVPGQPPAPPNPGAGPPRHPAPPQPRQVNRAVFWVAIVFAALVLVVLGSTALLWLRGGSARDALPSPVSSESRIAHTDLVSTAAVGHTAQRHTDTDGFTVTADSGTRDVTVTTGRTRDEVGGTVHTAETHRGSP
ncbi:serine/threonine-protein kinase [Salinifilum ghardaiensis]